MKKTLFAAAFASLFSMTSCDKFNNNIAPANQTKTFFKYYGHVYDQKAAAVARTNDGGYLVLGSSSSFVTSSDQGFFYNYYLVRTDSLGNELWSKSYGNSQYDDIARKIIVLPEDQGYIIAGTRQRIDFSTGQALRKEQRIQLYHVDLEGTIVAESTIPNALEDGFNYSLGDIKMLPDGDFALVGTTSKITLQKYPSGTPASASDKTDIYIARLNIGTLTERWGLIDGFTGIDEGVSLHLGDQQTYIISGTSQDMQNDEAYAFLVAKYTDFTFAGSVANKFSIGDAGRNIIAADAAYDSSTTQGTLTVLGNEQLSFAIGDDEPGQLVLMQFNVPRDRSGNITRAASTTPLGIYTNGSPQNAGIGSKANSITLLEDGSFLVTSTSTRIQGLNKDAHLLKITPELQVQWDWLFGTGASLDQAGGAMIVREFIPDAETPGAIIGYAMVGAFDFSSNNSVMGLIKANLNGSLTDEQ